MTPAAELTEFPTILEFAVPQLLAYRRETVIAEKFEAMVKLGRLNSRMKDFYDVWLLSQQYNFDGPILARAVSQTFTNRETPVTTQLVALTPAFATDAAKQTQWQGFLKKSRLEKNAPAALIEVVNALATFLVPIAEAVSESREFDHSWQPPGPWRVR